jgi:FkbM family methyltransferase
MKKKLEFLRLVVKSDILAAKLLASYSKLKGQSLSVEKVSDNFWRVSDGIDSLNIFTPYRILNYRKGIKSRLDNLAKSYGYGEFYQVNQNDIVIDIGANIGEFSLFCSNLGASVIAFEPDINIVSLLRENISDWGNSNQCVEVINQAISSVTGEATFYLKPLEADSTLIAPVKLDKFIPTKVSCIRLDKFIKDREINKIKLIKCDAEGAEPEVIIGCEKILSIIEYVAIDCGPERNGQSTYKEVISYLTSHGFKILSEPERTSRGLVVAKNMNIHL